MYIEVPILPLSSSGIVSMVVRREAVDVSSAEGKEDATEPEARGEYESGEDMTGL